MKLTKQQREFLKTDFKASGSDLVSGIAAGICSFLESNMGKYVSEDVQEVIMDHVLNVHDEIADKLEKL